MSCHAPTRDRRRRPLHPRVGGRHHGARAQPRHDERRAPDDAPRLAERAGGAGLDVRGVMGYEGHAVLVPDRAERAALTAKAMERLARVAEKIGGDIVSAGGTGTYDLNTAATEIQAGSY